MLFHILPRGLVLFSCGMISMFAAYLAWQRRNVRGGWLLALAMVAIAQWCFASGVESMVVGLQAKILWSQIEYIGFVILPPLLLLFVSVYTGKDKWISWRTITPIFLLPVFTLGLVWTNSMHHWIWEGFSPGPPGSNSYIYIHGWWYFVFILYYYLITSLTIFILLWKYNTLSIPYRQQRIVLIAASLIPSISGLVYVLDLNPFPGVDISPIGAATTGLVMVWGIYRFRLLELVPVARDAVVEQLMDAVIVLDRSGMIADLNPAAMKLIGKPYQDWFGVPASAVTAFDLVHLTSHTPPIELMLADRKKHFLETQVSDLRDRKGHLNGQIILLHDVTKRRQALLAVQEANQKLQAQIDEIQSLQGKLQQQAEQDSLTGLFNRRYMEDILEQVLRHATSVDELVSVVMIDIDHFKNVNDHYGHKAGDVMLQRLGKMFIDMIRKEDIACRYGGEEFVIVLPGANAEIARVRAEHWRAAFEDMQVDYRGESLRVTLSAGVAEYPKHGATSDEVLWAADHALYAAKEAGRNCVLVYSNGVRAGV